MNYFDTAPDYCDEHSEDIFGQHFKRWTAVHFMFPQMRTLECR
ncbi:MAG: hypothetical protein ACLSCV_00535 [Acutalibacteraceae bacterium]